VNAFNSTWPSAAPVMHAQPVPPDFGWLRSLPHRAYLNLDACDTAPGVARRWLEALLREWSLEEYADDALLVASELVSNSVAETGKAGWARCPPVGLRVHGGPSALVMEVWDAVLGAPMPRSATEDDESGRGLAIVAGLSARCGFYYCENRGGKVAWAILGTPGSGAGKFARPGLPALLLASRSCRQRTSRAAEGR
jgi:hypothetical protein